MASINRQNIKFPHRGREPGHVAASFDGLQPVLAACHCNFFSTLANKLLLLLRYLVENLGPLVSTEWLKLESSNLVYMWIIASISRIR